MVFAVRLRSHVMKIFFLSFLLILSLASSARADGAGGEILDFIYAPINDGGSIIDTTRNEGARKARNVMIDLVELSALFTEGYMVLNSEAFLRSVSSQDLV